MVLAWLLLPCSGLLFCFLRCLPLSPVLCDLLPAYLPGSFPKRRAPYCLAALSLW